MSNEELIFNYIEQFKEKSSDKPMINMLHRQLIGLDSMGCPMELIFPHVECVLSAEKPSSVGLSKGDYLHEFNFLVELCNMSMQTRMEIMRERNVKKFQDKDLAESKTNKGFENE